VCEPDGGTEQLGPRGAPGMSMERLEGSGHPGHHHGLAGGGERAPVCTGAGPEIKRGVEAAVEPACRTGSPVEAHRCEVAPERARSGHHGVGHRSGDERVRGRAAGLEDLRPDQDREGEVARHRPGGTRAPRPGRRSVGGECRLDDSSFPGVDVQSTLWWPRCRPPCPPASLGPWAVRAPGPVRGKLGGAWYRSDRRKESGISTRRSGNACSIVGARRTRSRRVSLRLHPEHPIMHPS
jgi:hypothetical protein